jgi:Flp pilus assembly protein protease CpaA
MFVLAIFAIPICLSDWRTRRIPNIYLFYMLYLIFAVRLFLPVKSIMVIIVTAVLVILLSLTGMGAGDAKLIVITVLALNLSNFASLSILAGSIYIAAVVQIILIWLYSAQIPKSIPLAVAIFCGSALYLAACSSPSLRQYADALVNSW